MRRLRVLLGLSMFGEGLVCAVAPYRYPMLWKIKGAPKAYDELMDYMARHQTFTRSLALLEMAAGLWMALGAVEEISIPLEQRDRAAPAILSARDPAR